MDQLRQAGKQIRKIMEESKQNARRVSRNFPQIERKVDAVIFDTPYKMEFALSDHPHSVKLNLYISPPASCFKCNIAYSSPETLQAVATSPLFGPGDGNPYPGVYTGLSSNVPGIPDFEIGPQGILVPQDGVYTIQFVGGTAGVTVATNSTIVASVRHNGIIKAQQVFTIANGKLPVAPAFFGANVNLYGLCIEARAGDSMESWMIGSGIAFYNPTGTLTIRLVGLL